MKVLGTLLGVVLVIAGMAAPIVFAVQQQHWNRNFRVVRPGVLYRSAQLPTGGLKRLQHDYGIRTIVCIRDESPTTEAERQWCQDNEVTFVRIDGKSWDGKPGAAPVDACLRQFLDVVNNPANHPVLVHCYAGTHRTGGYVAIYRMETEGWSNDEAIEELRRRGYTSIDQEADIRGYLQNYRSGVLKGTKAQR